MSESRCYECDIRLAELPDQPDAIHKLKCPRCHDLYFVCRRCKWYEHTDNLKGDQCIDCARWFCMACVQNSGELVDEEPEDPGEDNYRCGQCARSQLNE